MTAEQLISYKNFLGQKASDPLEAYLKSFNKDYHEEYYDDVIGTTYLANGEFAKAIPYLKMVSHDFLTRQRMYEYTYRDFTLPRWLYKQRDDDAQGSSTNKKVDFCQDMINLQSSYNQSSGETQKQLAYNLATRYYQASYLGDCWFITEYGQSITDTARVDRLDFVAEAIRYLNESAQSSNYTLHLNSLYGLAFIPNEEWCDWDYDWNNNKRGRISENDFGVMVPRENVEYDQWKQAPAGEGIILSGVAGQRIDMSESTSNAARHAPGIMGNMLIGTPTAPYVVTEDGVYQVRENTDGSTRFYLAVQGEVVPKGKAYCQYTISGQPTEVAIIWSGETLINAIMRDINDPSTPHFDLQGRRIYKIDADATGKKIHIVKGRKIVVK